MKPLTKGLILLAVAAFYTLLYVGSSYPEKCSEDCQRLYQLDTTLTRKFDYFYGARRCTNSWTSDTLCIQVKDTIGIDWDRFADTICLYARGIGLYQQKLFLIRYSNISADTVARKQCP